MDSLFSIHFIRPGFLLALVPLYYAIGRWMHHRHTYSQWRGICDPILLDALLVQNKEPSQKWPWIALAIAWTFCFLALAGWSLSSYEEPLFQSIYPTVILLDCSEQMSPSDLTPDRFTRAKYKLLDLLDSLQESQTGLVAFTSKPFVVSPLTEDAKTIASLVPALSLDILPVKGSQLKNALKQAENLLHQAGYQKGQLILLTATTPNDSDFETAQALAKKGISLSIIGIGTEDGAPIANAQGWKNGQISLSKLPRTLLMRFANTGKGIYTDFSNDDADIHLLLSHKDSQKTDKSRHQSILQWKDQGVWLLWFLLPFVLLVFRKGRLSLLCK